MGKIFRWVIVPVLLAVLFLPQTLARTYTITDGERVVTYTTFATDPEAVLDRAGWKLQPCDTYTAQGASGITVNRGKRVSVRFRGQARTVSAGEETVGQLLNRLGLTVGEGDVLSHPLQTPVAEGMRVQVDQILCRQETYTVDVPHETVCCDDASLPMGVREVLIPGTDGELLRREEVTYVNGEAVSRVLLEESLITAPVTEVIAAGTGKGEAPDTMPVIEDGYIYLPTGEVLTYTGTTTVRATAYTHTDEGCDMITATGSTVHIGTVAVDPRYIPYGTRMFIVANDGSYVYGISEAEDCGGAIKGDRVDLYFPTYEACMAFGWRTCTVYFLG